MNQEIEKRIQDLNPAQRKLFFERLNQTSKGKGITITKMEINLEKENRIPLSFPQQRLWFLTQLDKNSAAYHCPVDIEFNSPVQKVILEKSIQIIMDRHSILKTYFSEENGVPFQKILSNLSFQLEEIDLKAYQEGEKKELAKKIAQEYSQRPFDLTKAPLFRTLLISFDQNLNILHVNFHHIITDGWSMGIFRNELLEVYHSLLKQKEVNLPKLEIQYFDFCDWQKRQCTNEAIENALDYWKKKLTGAQELLEFPSAKKRPRNLSNSGDYIYKAIPSTISERIRIFCLEMQITPYVFFLTLFKTILYKYSGINDIVVGVPTAGRKHSELENLIGFFINFSISRTYISNERRFLELAKEIQEEQFESFKFDEIPFELILNRLEISRNTNSSPLFQVCFLYHNMNLAGLKLNGMYLSKLAENNGTAKYEISLSVNEHLGQFEICLEFMNDIYDKKIMNSFLSTLIYASESIVKSKTLTIGNIDLFKEKRIDIQPSYIEGQMTTFSNTLLHELFEGNVSAYPDKTAIYFNKEVSYKQLNNIAEEIAMTLTSMGITQKSIVGIYLNRSIELIASMIAVLKIGCTYLPLDPDYPQERISYIIEDSNAIIIITSKLLSQKIHNRQISKLLVDSDSIPKANHYSISKVKNSPIDPAYMLYTSGSTGKPKGVKVKHSSIVNFIHSMHTKPGSSREDVFLALTSVSFDISVLEIFLPLSTGASIILGTEKLSKDGLALLKLLNEHKPSPNIVQATPSTWQILIESGWVNKLNIKALVGGEILTAELGNSLFYLCNEVWNMYGPTETTIWSCIYRLSEDDIKKEKSISIGTPINNTTVVILDENLNLVPKNCPGELLIAGKGVCDGYHNRDELNKEKFITKIIHGVAQRFYKTGDIAFIDENNEIHFLGRKDSQVKFLGYRIEIEEIESILKSLDYIHNCAVTIKTDKLNSPRLIAYLIFKNNAPPIDLNKIRSFLQEQLPHFMIPSLFIPIENLPYTPNMKLDRTQLPEPDFNSLSITSDRSPKSKLEREVQKIMQELLNLKKIGVTENFFRIGGTSLTSIILLKRIKKELNIEIEIPTLFQFPTIEGIAKSIEKRRKKTKLHVFDSLISLQPLGEGDPIFCVHPLDGQSLCFMDFAAHFEGKRQIFGFQSPELSLKKNAISKNTVKSIAALYVRELKAIKPTGPYTLLGWSFGALIAFEIAVQLEMTGNKIDTIMIIDTPSPLIDSTIQRQRGEYIIIKNKLSIKFYKFLRFIDRLNSFLSFHLMVFYSFGTTELLKHLLKMISKGGYLFVFQKYLPNLFKNLTAYKNYTTKEKRIYPNRFLLFKADNSNLKSKSIKKFFNLEIFQNDPSYGWQKHSTTHVETYDINGNHVNIFIEKENAKAAAIKIYDTLSQKQF
ncbi:hypothetical protein DLM76_12430 [Leptospira yasudae]|uniref:non-ribosomal peptide synthetase n=1 Tax=Leptospira yasudae TaxID=2202201 RepID=UPI000E59CF9C|nr:non-ribosomal peptide synthetase [Leptospira yasudae]RHX93800.1 hypothetical protein DLM76_12430 [Leptospira yasudae]